MSEQAHNPELRDLESTLKTLAPVPSRMDRDQLMFRAGQASGGGRGWFWPGATALLATLAATLGTLLCLRPAPRPVEHIVYLPAPGLPSPEEREFSPPSLSPEPLAMPDYSPPRPGRGNYLQFRKHVVRWGVDELPGPPPMDGTGEEPMTPARLRDLPSGTLFASPN